MCLSLTINSLDEFPEVFHFELYAGLSKGVVGLDSVQEFRRAPETVSFDQVQRRPRQFTQITVLAFYI